MKPIATIIAALSLFATACGGPAVESNNQDSIDTASSAILSSGDPLVGNWYIVADPSWKIAMNTSGDAVKTSVPSGHPCWTVGSPVFDNLTLISTGYYEGRRYDKCMGSGTWYRVAVSLTDLGGGVVQFTETPLEISTYVLTWQKY
ncbi:hypothetical protein JGU66_12480 [Myxococcaceae bacterium JPH2]|nr:hypothetical protein [Myxococcaceae bacterium JPH2]